jgi:hypothetical protein
MGNECSPKKKVDPEKVNVLRMLPREVKEALTPEEVNAILFEDVWPDSLQEKLKEYIVDE